MRDKQYSMTADGVPFEVGTNDCYEVKQCAKCNEPVILCYPDTKDDYKGNWPEVRIYCPACLLWPDWSTLRRLQQQRGE